MTTQQSNDMNDTPIYQGIRGDQFRSFIRNLLKIGRIKEKYIDILTDKEGMEEYAKAFTSITADEENNYEYYEQMGDAFAGNFLVMYFHRRFPGLRHANGVKIVARLKILYGSKQKFWGLARQLGFWKYISASEHFRTTKMKPVLEDVYEAFLGVTNWLLDMKVKMGIGYPFVYNIQQAIFDEMDVPLAYEGLFDAKTRLKELFDHEKTLGKLKYESTRKDDKSYTVIFGVDGKKKNVLGKGIGSLKKISEQNAAQDALKKLEKAGIKRDVLAYYSSIKKFPKQKALESGKLERIMGDDYEE